ncbi:hypothetical protein O8C83_01985 [Aliarcobacter butzleri]|uniref:hypothetical protein n=1 Tax=Aliarcobacter butzleri TaxID=28197 RepID=UPI00263F36DB|nr:hypothetical protein [Aliarcobacter butzleri]MDN5099580.1 hypothetical protein [Aliarcobacter butzleri]
MNDKNLELIPDKDGFLFEIEDKIYLITQLFGILIYTSFLLIVLTFADFSLKNLFEHSRLGRLVVFFSIPVYVFYILKTLYYAFFQKRKTIKFYETHILLLNSNLILLENIKRICKIKLNLLPIKREGQTDTFSIKILYVLFLPYIILLYFTAFISVYILYQKKLINNLVFVINKNEKFGGIAYTVLNSEEKSKVDLYFKKYLNTNLDEVETRWIFIPDK